MICRASRRQEFHDALRYYRQTDLVLLTANDFAERGGHILSVFQLGAIGAELHRTAGVEDQSANQVGFILVEAGVGPPGPSEHSPVQTAEVLARGILTVIGKLA